MTKQEKIDNEIKRLKLEIERLEQLKKVVTGILGLALFVKL